MEDKYMEGMLLRFYDGELSKDEIAEVEAWMNLNEENRKTAEQVFYLCFASDALDAKENIDEKSAYNKVRARIRSKRWHNFMHSVERAAAILILPLIALACWMGVTLKSQQDTYVEVRSTTGMVNCVTLPDNSQVWLNSDSYLRYPTRFGNKERRVLLFGEGYFSVAKDSGRKFIVDAHSAEIEVYGTEFNLEAYEAEHIHATLVSGSVGLRYDDSNHCKQLLRFSPGQQAIYNNRTGMVYLDNANLKTITSWKDGKLILENTSLEDALRMIGNKYNVQFIIRNDNIRSQKFTGTFSNQSLDVIFRHFNMSSNIRFNQLESEDTRKDGSLGRAVFEVL